MLLKKWLNDVRGINAFNLTAKHDFFAFKAEAGKLDIKKFVNVPTRLDNLETKVDDLDVGNLKTVPVVLKKLSDVVDKKVVKNIKFNTPDTKVNNLQKEIPVLTTIIRINQYNTDKQNLKKKIEYVHKKVADGSGLLTTAVLNTKITGLVKKTDYDAKISKTEKEQLEHNI